MKGKLISIFVGIFIAVVSWVPLWIVEAYDRYAMPVGLGLFAFAASFVGGVIALGRAHPACYPRLTGLKLGHYPSPALLEHPELA
jgi:hypothetical protein